MTSPHKYLLIRICFLLFPCFFLTYLSAQPFYQTGFIIKNNGDTLSGKISPRSGQNAIYCKFIPHGDDRITSYSPFDIKAFIFHNGKYFLSQTLPWKDSSIRIFTEVLLDADICLTTTTKTRGTRFYLSTPDKHIFALSLKKQKFIHSASIYHQPPNVSNISETYKDTLHKVFNSSRRASEQSAYAEYNEKTLMSLTEAFIRESCKDNNCIRYKKDLRFRGSRFGIYGSIPFSIIRFQRTEAHSDLILSYALGIYSNEPLLRVSDKLSLQLEFLARHMEINDRALNFLNQNFKVDINYWTFGIPVMLKYRFLNKRISPSVSFGKEISVTAFSNVKYGPYIDPRILPFYKSAWIAEISLDSYLSFPPGWFFAYRFQYFENGIDAGSYTENFKVYSNALLIGTRF